MEGISFIKIIVVIFICYMIVSLIKRLAKGKRAQEDLSEANLRIMNGKKSYEQLKTNHIHEVHELYQQIKQIQTKMNERSKDFEVKQNEYEKRINEYEEIIKEKDYLFEQLNKKSNGSIKYISSLIADHLTLQYDISEKYLKTKKHPAHKEALRISELKEEAKLIIQKNKILQYKYEFLFQLFPDLELYVDDIESISELSNLKNLEDLKTSVDKTRYYLSKEEYDQLPENKRNQLALDRYIKSQKTKWQIGRDYELFIGYEYNEAGWDIEYFGIEKQLEDMGRDLIATKGNEIHIIQCKYWAQKKLIHEKHIAQLYGTTVQFILSSSSKKKVVPVFATNISLSYTARDFANYLGVKLIENKPMTDFPRIKCNINQDELKKQTKIYHLPMDQQYDKTKICKQGEFFAFTVQEAVNAGFRRAWRWHGDIS